MNALILIKRQGVEFYFEKAEPIVYDFPSKVLAQEEVKDDQKLHEQISDLLVGVKLEKLDTVIILAEELIFQKDVSNLDPATIVREKEKLMTEVPFDTKNVISKILILPDKKIIVATNGELPQALTKEITDGGGKAAFIVPAPLLGVSAVNKESFNQIIGNKKLLEAINLLETKAPQEKRHPIFLFVLLFLIVVLIAGGFFLYQMINRPKVKIGPRVAPIVKEEKPVTSPAAVVSPKAKKDLAVKVINGTGTVGDAKKVKDALLALGYQNIVTDNLEVQNATASGVSLKDSVDSQFKEEIIAALQKLFKSVISEPASPASSFEVTIITGK